MIRKIAQKSGMMFETVYDAGSVGFLGGNLWTG
jgi:hypothetical protein